MKVKEKRSPRISGIRWGQITIEGYQEPFRDVKLYPGGARAWDWTETGTHHSPGIQPADVQELLDHGADVVVLSTGFQGRLEVTPETQQMLDAVDVQMIILDSERAVARYNEYQASRLVGALIHSTC